jgi:hypothetical protein
MSLTDDDLVLLASIGADEQRCNDMTAPEDADRDPALPDCRAIATMVMQLFEHWQLDPDDKAAFLGLNGADEDAWHRFRSGEMVGADTKVRERVGLLLSIHTRLRSLFPENRVLVYGWMKSPNKSFGDKTPVEAVRAQGLSGLLSIRSYLDRAADA